VHRGTAEAQDEGGVKPFMCLCVYVVFTVYCLLFTVYCLLFTVYCLLFTVYKMHKKIGCQAFFRHRSRK
jgi:hypothetical protein